MNKLKIYGNEFIVDDNKQNLISTEKTNGFKVTLKFPHKDKTLDDVFKNTKLLKL